MTAEKSKLEAACLHCGKLFEKSRSWQEHCSAECRQAYHFARHCGHQRPIGTCTIAGCQVQAMFLKLKLFEERFAQCRCGLWFERTQKTMKHCSKRCREVAKHEAEKARKRVA